MPVPTTTRPTKSHYPQRERRACRVKGNFVRIALERSSALSCRAKFLSAAPSNPAVGPRYEDTHPWAESRMGAIAWGLRPAPRFPSSLLSRYRIVAFATHGLMPGDLDGLKQPAPALTAPEVAGVDGDGAWIVLSACDTGGWRRRKERMPFMASSEPSSTPGQGLCW